MERMVEIGVVSAMRAGPGVTGMDVAWWQVAAVTNLVVAVAYLAIATAILGGVLRTSQWRHNPLAVATGAIFLTCAVHHGTHGLHLLLVSDHGGHASMREATDQWFVGGWDVLSAAAALWYWRLRRLFPALVRGPSLFADLESRRKQALTLHDDVVQGLATAKLQLELGRRDEALESMQETLETAKSIITGLLVDIDGRIDPSLLPDRAPNARS